MLIITDLKSDTILSIVDRNSATFTPNMRYRVESFYEARAKYSKIRLHSACPNKEHL